MANRDAKKIERTLKDFSLGAVGGGAGLTPVNALPEKGNVGTLYKTPDGNIYSWFHEEITKEVEVPPTLEVGKTYELKEQILFKTFEDSINNALEDPNKRSQHKSIEGDIVNDNLSFNMYFSRDFEGTGTSTYSAMFSYLEEADNKIRYFYNEGEEQPDEYVHRQIIGWTGPAEITVTQKWIDNLSENWGEPFDINNLNFLFVGSTETVTVVNEGYTQLNGIVLDYNNIINNSIYLDDKNYNAQIIYDTLLRGGSALLKTSGIGEGFALQCLKSVAFGTGKDGIHGALMIFENQHIDVILKNQFDPISTIKGQELIDLIQAYEPMEINNLNLIDYIASISSSEEANKELYRGIAISLFEGLIEYDLFYPLPDEEEAPSGVTQIAHFVPKAYRDDVLTAYPEKGQLNCLEFLAQNIGNGYVSNSNLSEIDATKDYNCDIIVKFSDGTTKTVPMDKHLLYGVEGDDESPLFRVHIMN